MTGVDPAAAMLDVARATPNGDAVEWVRATAQACRLHRRFDLVVMTGHAVQVLLTDAHMRAACATMHEHLALGGRAVFDTRNARIDWPALWDGREERLAVDGGPVLVSRHCGPMTGRRLRFETVYAFPDEEPTSVSELRFPTLGELEAHLHAVGLRVENVRGDWDGSPFDMERSHEMILTARRIV